MISQSQVSSLDSSQRWAVSVQPGFVKPDSEKNPGLTPIVVKYMPKKKVPFLSLSIKLVVW